MNELYKGWNNTAQTENGAVTNYSSLNKNLDFFFLAGASRGQDITKSFIGAYVEDEELSIRTLLWMRDAREGAGERTQFRNLIQHLSTQYLKRIIDKIPELGRWDDMFVLFDINKTIDLYILEKIKKGLLVEHNGLLAKWLPRKGVVARKIRNYLQVTPKGYRKLIVPLSNTVEQKLCARDFDNIDFGKVPSLATSRYKTAFYRNAPVKYQEYINSLVKGEAKINAGAILPHEIINALAYGNEEVSNKQWEALPNYLEGNDERILPMVDVSGSMHGLPMDVAVALGLYISERSEGVFKDMFITFSSQPELVYVKGTLKQRLMQMKQAAWGMSTNIELTFKHILEVASKNSLTNDQLPSKLLILSDMEFDVASSGKSNYDNIKKLYNQAGYTLPEIIFWNLSGRVGNVPVKKDQKGTALVSGFSPSIMTSLLGGDLNPESVMMKTILNDRYSF